MRDLRRTRSGRLSVPTRDTLHRQKIVFNGADVSVDHGEYGKVSLRSPFLSNLCYSRDGD